MYRQWISLSFDWHIREYDHRLGAHVLCVLLGTLDLGASLGVSCVGCQLNLKVKAKEVKVKMKGKAGAEAEAEVELAQVAEEGSKA